MPIRGVDAFSMCLQKPFTIPPVQESGIPKASPLGLLTGEVNDTKLLHPWLKLGLQPIFAQIHWDFVHKNLHTDGCGQQRWRCWYVQ